MQFSETKVIRELHPTLTVKVFEADVLDILCSALYGGIGYWAILDNITDDYEKAPPEESTEETCARLLLRGKSIRFEDIEGEQSFELTLDKFINGIEKAVNDEGFNIVDGDGELNCCNIDACIAESIIQYAIFGEVIYA